MDRKQLEDRIFQRGREFYQSISGEAPSVFNKGWWTGKVMDWSMKNEDFKVKLFRFVDVMPYLTTSESLSRHIKEYFSDDSGDLPSVMKFGLLGAGLAGRLGEMIMIKGIRTNIERMGRQFIIGENAKEAIRNMTRLRRDGFAFVVDLLGEATVSEAEAEARLAEHLELLAALETAQTKWKALDAEGDLDWGHAPRINLAVKPSAFYSQSRPRDFHGSVDAIFNRLVPVYRKVRELGGFMCIDMESLEYKDMTIALYKRLRSDDEFRDYPHLGLVLQAYLRQTDQDLEELISWARAGELPISVRLVKGAYWDYETVKAKQQGWEVPVYTIKADTDAAFERHAARILENSAICHLACGSHNIRSIAAVLEYALALGVPKDRYEFQILFGMAEPIRKGLLKGASRVRLYCPYGDLIPGMAYLVRRLLENTANESFLRRSFADEADIDRLMEDPEEAADREHGGKDAAAPEPPEGLAPFSNEPQVDFCIPEAREAFPAAIAEVRAKLNRTYGLIVDGREIRTADRIDSLNPANRSEVVGSVCMAGVDEVHQAVAAAKAALPAWAGLPAKERAGFLLQAASVIRRTIFEQSSWQILEVGKQWDQAYADVSEAIDFMEYYAREMIRLGRPRRMGHAPGELNTYGYRPKGVAAVIAPWNFPLAISTGMTAAALAAGNAVVYKPSSLSAVIGYHLAQVYREAGLPDGVFNFLPGRSPVMGDALVGHPDVALIAFTGSMEAGLAIMQKAAAPTDGQHQVKKVIAEMGGKNAVIIDDDAELDEAILHVLMSAFGFQGQKCSACSRVIVVKSIYEKFIGRLVEAARSLRLGPSENPANYMGPVVDDAARDKIMNYVELAGREGRVLLSHQPPAEIADQGCYAPLVIVEGITPEHRLAQEEIFGPVLAVMQVEDFDQALEWANSTRYALTGGVFSRSPEHLEQARREFNVGNLYLNRNITGALVERQPFGGFRMSGIGSKAGGPDYLLQFMDPVAVTENTMRRGFAPVMPDDDWV